MKVSISETTAARLQKEVPEWQRTSHKGNTEPLAAFLFQPPANPTRDVSLAVFSGGQGPVQRAGGKCRLSGKPLHSLVHLIHGKANDIGP